MARRGNWQDVWSSFDARRKAKANDTDEGAAEAEAAASEPDMFGGAGSVAAE